LLALKEEYELNIAWKPILVGGIFNSINPSVYESRKNPVKEKSDYSQKDLNDWANVRNIRINWPKVFPVNSVKAMRGAFFAINKGKIEEYAESIFKSYWTEGKDISSNEILLQIVKVFNWDEQEFLLYINDPQTKERLINNTKELMDRGGFGSPTFFVDETNMFFGNDRIQLIKEIL
jgi:2-hydroxychromene-2-carboxylate isomerase